ncbi:MAG: AAA family ATPase [Methylococcales bacterium]|nr:AAA family ATPase [Methylococcales bacterium]
MFITAAQIASAINALSDVHPFHGITFLACKRAKLPVGEKINFAMDSVTNVFLTEFHKIDPDSECFYQPFKSTKKWLKHDYAASGLQAINTQTFGNAFLHEPNTRIWGWHSDYVSVLASKLPKRKRIPAFHLAVWLFKNRDWDDKTTSQDLIDNFVKEFFITEEEQKELFDLSIPSDLSLNNIFQKAKASWFDLRQIVTQPPDAKPDQGGTLAFLETINLGPAEHLILTPANRLTLITGDNGLGKTFLLECAWWALTGIWADRPAFPRPAVEKSKAMLIFAIQGEQYSSEKKTIAFDWKTLSWQEPKQRPTIPGLTVYARVDGSFAVWDPAKQMTQSVTSQFGKQAVFSGNEVWDGLQGRIEGLIRDWVRWQNNPTKYPFGIFTKVLACLSPPDLGPLIPGEPVRIPDDPRDIPTIKHPYGDTPIVYSSAGVKRIITLAYLIVWAWNEHIISAELARTKPQRRMVILVDEMEAHLHPRWQREVLPALMSIGVLLNEKLETQFLVATHSPLVMASAEPVFDESIDSLYHFDISNAGDVSLKEMNFARFGDISSWLTSPIFELKHARSKEAEIAIEAAKELQKTKDVSSTDVKEASFQLIKYLGSDDKFWPRWISFAEKHGIKL